MTRSSRLTHCHISGVNGALLQAMAVKLALRTDQGKVDPVAFLGNLLQQIMPFEEGIDHTEAQSENGSEMYVTVYQGVQLAIIILLSRKHSCGHITQSLVLFSVYVLHLWDAPSYCVLQQSLVLCWNIHARTAYLFVPQISCSQTYSV